MSCSDGIYPIKIIGDGIIGLTTDENLQLTIISEIFASEIFLLLVDIVHCYGHADSGVTFSRVCAKEVMEIVKDRLPPDSKRQDNLPEHG